MDSNTENLMIMGMTGMLSDPIVRNIVATKMLTDNNSNNDLLGAFIAMGPQNPMPTVPNVFNYEMRGLR